MTMVYDGLEVDTWKLPLGVMRSSRPQHQFETNQTATLHATPLLQAEIQNTSCQNTLCTILGRNCITLTCWGW